MTKSAFKRTKKKHSYNNHFLESPVYQGDIKMPMKIKLIQFDANNISEKDVSTASSIKNIIQPDKLNWFHIVGMADVAKISAISEEFDLHRFDVKDMLSEQKVVKVVLYNAVTYILMSAFSLDDSDMLIETQIALIVGDNYIVSIQDTDIPVFDEVKKAISEDSIQIRQKGVDFLLYVVLNAINSSNMNVSMKMEDELSDIEDKLIDKQMSTDILHFLRMRRIDCTHIKRFVLSFREEYNNLLHNTNNIIKPENIIYFNDYDDRLRTTLGNLDSFRESLFSLLDLYYNNNNLIMNDIIKRLTIVSTIFIPLTFMVGVWGMNFKFMPEIDWPYGYAFAWGILALIALAACLFMKKKKWF